MSVGMVLVVTGSSSDLEVMEECTGVLKELEIGYEIHVASAHRTPDRAIDMAKNAADRGIEVIVAGAGHAAHLAGTLASHTVLPVIGVPIDSSPLKGLDALLSTVQMPAGIPVATVGIGKSGAKNAGLLAAEVLSLKHPELVERLRSYRESLAKKVAKADDRLQEKESERE